jgi:hypothetical protein
MRTQKTRAFDPVAQEQYRLPPARIHPQIKDRYYLTNISSNTSCAAPRIDLKNQNRRWIYPGDNTWAEQHDEQQRQEPASTTEELMRNVAETKIGSWKDCNNLGREAQQQQHSAARNETLEQNWRWAELSREKTEGTSGNETPTARECRTGSRRGNQCGRSSWEQDTCLGSAQGPRTKKW